MRDDIGSAVVREVLIMRGVLSPRSVSVSAEIEGRSSAFVLLRLYTAGGTEEYSDRCTLLRYASDGFWRAPSTCSSVIDRILSHIATARKKSSVSAFSWLKQSSSARLLSSKDCTLRSQ